MNKKAGLPDGFFLVIAFFVILLIFIFMYVVVSNVNDEFQKSSYITAEAATMSADLTGKYANLFDKMFLFIVVGLGFAVLAGAWFINSHPALFWISTPILAFTIWLGALFSNLYKEISTHDQVATYSADFIISNFIFDNYVIFITVFVLLLALTLYAKPQNQEVV